MMKNTTIREPIILTLFREQRSGLRQEAMGYLCDESINIPMAVLQSFGNILTSLVDLSARLRSCDSPQSILTMALDDLMGKLTMRKGCIISAGRNGHEVVHSRGIKYFVASALNVSEVIQTDDLGEGGGLLQEYGLEWIIPIGVDRSTNAYLCFGEAAVPEVLDDVSRTYMDLVQAITTHSVTNAVMMLEAIQRNRMLEERNHLVTNLFEGSRDFNMQDTFEGIMGVLSHRLLDQLNTTSFAIEMAEPVMGGLVHTNRYDTAMVAELLLACSFVEQACRISDVQAAPADVLDNLIDAGIGIIAPLNIQGGRKGTLIVWSKLNLNPFTSEEVRYAEALGSLAVSAIEMLNLRHERIERLRIQSQLDVAAEIQRNLLPINLPSTDGFDIAAITIPSINIGGDYYDVIPLNLQRTLVTIADVAGKGIPAAILMANTQAAINVLASMDQGTSELVNRVNTHLCENTDPDLFVTLFVCELDSTSGDVCYVNAGHIPPVVIRKGGVGRLRTGGPIAGVICDTPPYPSETITLGTGDVLVLFTDGVVEMQTAQGEEYGVKRIVESVHHSRDATAADILDTIMADLNSFNRRADIQVDDSSIVVIKRL